MSKQHKHESPSEPLAMVSFAQHEESPCSRAIDISFAADLQSKRDHKHSEKLQAAQQKLMREHNLNIDRPKGPTA
jgi:hypothetical protein